MIFLRDTLEKDVDFVIKVESDPCNSPFICQWSNIEHLSSLSNKDIKHIIIEDNSKKKIGYIIIAGLLSPNKSLELKRIVIIEKGKGYGKGSLEKVKHFAFEELKFHRLWLDVRLHNKVAKSLYQKCGFKDEGLLRDAVFVNDHYESIHIMSILEKEYSKELLFS